MADQKIDWNGDEGKFIDLTEAAAGTNAYRSGPSSRDNNGCKAHYFGGKKLLQVLSQGKAVGVRVYYGKAQEDDPTRGIAKGAAELYIVPVDSKGSDILADENNNSLILDRSWPCPIWCDPNGSPLT